MTTRAVSLVMGCINAPYSQNLTAKELSVAISSVAAIEGNWGPVFSFFTEVPLEHQKAFIADMGVSLDGVTRVAEHLQERCPFPIALIS
jgi:hypothetical protein